MTISPNGNAYLMSLSIDQDPTSVFGSNPDAMLVSKSTDGGLTWSDPTTLIRDTNPNRLNDKNSMTADPNDSRYVYAIWDRLESPPSGNTNPTRRRERHRLSRSDAVHQDYQWRRQLGG